MICESHPNLSTLSEALSRPIVLDNGAGGPNREPDRLWMTFFLNGFPLKLTTNFISSDHPIAAGYISLRFLNSRLLRAARFRSILGVV